MRKATLYSPLESVCLVVTVPLAVSVMVIVALGTTAPVESCTVPRMLPVVTCAMAGVLPREKKRSDTTNADAKFPVLCLGMDHNLRNFEWLELRPLESLS